MNERMQDLTHRWGLSARRGFDRVTHHAFDAMLDRFNVGYKQRSPSELLILKQQAEKEETLRNFAQSLEDDLEGVKGFTLEMGYMGDAEHPALVAKNKRGEANRIDFDLWNGQFLVDVFQLEGKRRHAQWVKKNDTPIAFSEDAMEAHVLDMAAHAHVQSRKQKDVRIAKWVFRGAVVGGLIALNQFGDDTPDYPAENLTPKDAGVLFAPEVIGE